MVLTWPLLPLHEQAGIPGLQQSWDTGTLCSSNLYLSSKLSLQWEAPEDPDEAPSQYDSTDSLRAIFFSIFTGQTCCPQLISQLDVLGLARMGPWSSTSQAQEDWRCLTRLSQWLSGRQCFSKAQDYKRKAKWRKVQLEPWVHPCFCMQQDVRVHQVGRLYFSLPERNSKVTPAPLRFSQGKLRGKAGTGTTPHRKSQRGKYFCCLLNPWTHFSNSTVFLWNLSLLYHFLSQLKPASNKALFSSSPILQEKWIWTLVMSFLSTLPSPALSETTKPLC